MFLGGSQLPAGAGGERRAWWALALVAVCLGGTVPFLFHTVQDTAQLPMASHAWIIGGKAQILFDVVFDVAMVVAGFVVVRSLGAAASARSARADHADAGPNEYPSGNDEHHRGSDEYGSAESDVAAAAPAAADAASPDGAGGEHVLPAMLVALATGLRLSLELTLLAAQFSDVGVPGGAADNVVGNALLLIWLLCIALTDGQGLVTALAYGARVLPRTGAVRALQSSFGY